VKSILRVLAQNPDFHGSGSAQRIDIGELAFTGTLVQLNEFVSALRERGYDVA